MTRTTIINLYGGPGTLLHDLHDQRHVLLKRSKPYNPKGRFESETDARDMDSAIRSRVLDTYPYHRYECDTTLDAVRAWVGRVWIEPANESVWRLEDR